MTLARWIRDPYIVVSLLAILMSGSKLVGRFSLDDLSNVLPDLGQSISANSKSATPVNSQSAAPVNSHSKILLSAIQKKLAGTIVVSVEEHMDVDTNNLEKALASAETNDVIVVRSGEYKLTQFKLEKSITIRGEPENNHPLPKILLSSQNGIEVTSGSVLKLENIQVSNPEGLAFALNGGSIIANGLTINNARGGIYGHGNILEVTNSSFENINDIELVATGYESVKLYGDQFKNSKIGVLVEEYASAEITHTQFANTVFSALVLRSPFATLKVSDSEFIHNAGPAVAIARGCKAKFKDIQIVDGLEVGVFAESKSEIWCEGCTIQRNLAATQQEEVGKNFLFMGGTIQTESLKFDDAKGDSLFGRKPTKH